MTLSLVLEVGLGLMLVYYVLGLIVSAITTQIARWTEMRAKDLKTGLERLLSEKYQDFIEHPCIHNLQEKRWFPLKGLKECQVDRIPASTFALALFDVLAPGAQHKGTIDDIKQAIEGLPPGELQQTLMTVVHGGIDKLEDAQKRIEGWYNDAMNGVTALYTHHAQTVVRIVTLVVTLVVGVDTIDIATSLWQEPTVRAAVAAKVDRYVQEQPEGDVVAAVSELGETRIPILWNRDTLPRDAIGWVSKLLGLFITWVAASQGSSYWYDLLKQIRSGPATATAGTRN